MLPPISLTDFLSHFFGLSDGQIGALWDALPRRQRDRLRNAFSKLDNTRPYSPRRERLSISAADLMAPTMLIAGLEAAVERGAVDRATANIIEEKLLALVGSDGDWR